MRERTFAYRLGRVLAAIVAIAAAIAIVLGLFWFAVFVIQTIRGWWS